MKDTFFYDTLIGRMGFVEEDGAITHIMPEEHCHFPDAEIIETPLIHTAFKQIEEYLCGQRTSFSFPIAPKGTPFQRSVWDALLKIPYGETRSYGEIASMIGNPKACRAVGMANHRNPILIVIPCHRVVGADQSLTGYAAGLNRKDFLLRLERAGSRKQKC